MAREGTIYPQKKESFRFISSVWYISCPRWEPPPKERGVRVYLSYIVHFMSRAGAKEIKSVKQAGILWEDHP